MSFTRSVLLLNLLLAATAHAQGVVRDDSPGGGRNEEVAGGVDRTGRSVDYLIKPELGQQNSGRSTVIYGFRDFDLAPGEVASFDGPNSIRTIISHVTGGSRSSIDGEIRSVIPGANLFFLNPAGVLFGSNASLDVRGSFFASTATQLRRDDGSIVDLRSSDIAPLLTVAAPDQFGFLNAAAPIEIDGADLYARGTLGLIASEIRMYGATESDGPSLTGDREVFLQADMIALGFGLVDSQRRVVLRGGELDFLGTSVGGPHISLEGQSIRADQAFFGVDDFGETPGTTVAMSADRIWLNQTSIAAFDGRVTLQGREEVHITGPGALSEEIETDTLEIQGRSILLDGANLFAPNMLIEGQRIHIGETAYTDIGVRPPGFLPRNPVGGNDRSIRLRASDEITIRNGGIIAPVQLEDDAVLRVGISTSRLEIADAGTIRVGVETDQPEASGGIVDIDADEVVIRNGGTITNGTTSTTNGGLVDISATRFIDVAGVGTGILTQTSSDGAGGTIRLSAPRVTVRDGALVAAGTGVDPMFPDPDPDTGEPPDFPDDPLPEPVPPPSGVGTGGSIVVTGDVITVENGATVSSASVANGDGGTVQLVAKESLRIAGGSDVSVSSMGGGNAGSVELRATSGSIAIADGAEVSSSTAGSGNGGTIVLDARDELSVTGGANITASSTGSGEAGDIVLRTNGAVRLAESTVSTSSMLSAGGDISVSGSLVDINDSTVTTDVGPGDGGRIGIEASKALVLRSGSQIVARAVDGTGGSIVLRAPALLRTADTVIDASSDIGVDGTVEIQSPVTDLNASLANLAATYVDPTTLLVERCQLRDRRAEGSFTLGGREGVAESPERRPGARYSVAGDRLDAADRGDLEEFLRNAPLQNPEAAPVARLLRSAEVLEASGSFSRARDLLGAALERAGRAEAARVLALRARLWARSGVYGNAERDFAAAERAAEELGDEALRARVLLDRANADAERGERERARGLHARALASAERARDAEVTALIRAATAVSAADLARAHELLSALPVTHDRLFAAIHVGLGLASRPDDAARLRAVEVLTQAAERAQDLGDGAAESYAWGHLAELYAREGRRADATELARRALVAGARADRHAAVYAWAGVLGDALRAEGNLEAAGRAYELGLDALENLRGEGALSARAQAELAAAFPGRALSTSLIDTLLARAARVEDAAVRAPLLASARDRLEASSRREIRDYFQDECLALERAGRSTDTDHALVVYPVVLDDRAELLVSGPDGLAQVRIDAPVSELRAAIHALRIQLEDLSTHEYRRPAAQLYDWLVRPLEPFLAQVGDEGTLVVVPSGPFAGIPFAALYDTRQREFLIEQRALAMSPGLSLIDARPLQTGPRAALQAALTRRVEDFPALAWAGSEVEEIHELVGGRTLLDAEFVQPVLDRELGSTPYEIVHIASHGEFGGDPGSAFLLTFDGRLGMSELADLIARTRFRDQPLELLTLSACQTAAGDERAALGLAGVAVRAGARSTLASLWSVNDPGTAQLMKTFYGELVKEGSSRARALQRAQQQMLGNATYRHPAYWAPFVLVGSWR